MAVLKMKKINICGLKKNRKAVLEQLQVQGAVEVTLGLEEDDVFQKMDTAKARNQFEKSAQVADSALEILDEYVPVHAGLTASLSGREPIGSGEFFKTADMRNEMLKTAYDINGFKKQISEQKGEILRLETQIAGLYPWLTLDVPMDEQGTGKTAVLIGSLPEERDDSSLREEISSKSERPFELHIISANRNQTCLALICLREDKNNFEEILRSRGFARPSQVSDKTPQDAVEEMRGEIEADQKEIERLEAEIRSRAQERDHLKRLADYFRIRAQKYQVLGGLLQSKETFLITGYVPEEKAEEVKESLTDKYIIMVELEDVSRKEEAPVVLKNNRFSASMEGVVESFGLPGKGEVDPTPAMSWFYVFLFGMMLSDAGYGLVMTVGCFAVLKKFPSMEESMKKMFTMFLYCGVSTFIWGLLFGSFFGNAVTVIGKTFFGVDIAFPALWFEPLNDPMMLLMYAALFGLIHMFTGLAIKAYMLIREKQYMEALVSVGFWAMLIVGAVMLLIPTDMFASLLPIGEVTYPAPLDFLAKALTIAGALGLLLFAGRRKKNPALRLALGAYELYNITGWLSDVLSYSRLLALCLATGVIAQVFNTMASMFGSGVVGVIAFVIIFVIGHVFNIALSLLSAYVHTNRLQFVEFFGKFYEGGGRAFEAFRTNTRYYKIKED